MKICMPGINEVFDINCDKITTLVIENPRQLFMILQDLQGQILGNDGKSIVSIDNKPVDISKNVELLTQFINFDINQKSLVNKVSTLIDKRANDSDFYLQTVEVMSNLEKLLIDIVQGIEGDIEFNKLSITSVVKAAGIEFNNEYDMLAEKIIDYMELVRFYDRDKLFILYNIRSLIDDEEATLFFDTCIKHGIKILCIESGNHDKLVNETVYIVDRDLCEIEIR